MSHLSFSFPVSYGQQVDNTDKNLKKISEDLTEIQSNLENYKEKTDVILEKITHLEESTIQNDDRIKFEFVDLKEALNLHENQINQIIEKIDSLNKDLTAHTIDSSSFDQFSSMLSEIQYRTSIVLSIITTSLGIAGGVFANRLYEKFKRRRELEDAKKQVQKDFERTNRIVCNAIRDTRNVLSDQFGPMIMINHMIDGTNSVHDEFLPHLFRLKLILWDFALPHMSQFTIKEKELLKQLKDLLNDTQEMMQKRHIAFRDNLTIINRSTVPNGAKALTMQNEIIDEFRERMRTYGKLYVILRREGVSWVELTKFSENTNLNINPELDN